LVLAKRYRNTPAAHSNVLLAFKIHFGDRLRE